MTTVDNDEILIVSGLPRSGTSMMMRMLEAGGLPILTDNVRRADEDNPEGYYEYERARSIARDAAWLPDARRKVVKVISALLRNLPPDYRYRIIFMRREMAEVLASQRQMLARRGEPTGDDDSRMAELFERHLQEVQAWLQQQPNIRALHISYNNILARPTEQVALVNHFMDNRLNTAAMVEIVDAALHRQRR